MPASDTRNAATPISGEFFDDFPQSVGTPRTAAIGAMCRER